MNAYLDIKEEVKAALAEGKPVVALESTIISHGMPFPQNLEMVHRCESLIRAQGAIPATIALMDGKIKVGLSEEEVMTLAKATDVVKVSRRDFAEVLANQKIGATTVAATMIAAAMAGIRFFATGGIGGVHRGYEQTMDVSADLEELSRNEVTVVCAGAKSILDLPRTLEYLETKGVPVIGYQTDVLPQFFCADSPYRLNSRMDTPQAIAHCRHTRKGCNPLSAGGDRRKKRRQELASQFGAGLPQCHTGRTDRALLQSMLLRGRRNGGPFSICIVFFAFHTVRKR